MQKRYWKNCKVNADDFVQVKTKEHAYILGLLWADGTLCDNKEKGKEISITMKSEDILTLSEIFNKTGQWNITHKFKNSLERKPQTRFRTSNGKLFDYLLDKDYKSKNNSPSKIIETISDGLKHYWFQGFFDGDGCFYVNQKLYFYRTNISGPYDQDWSFVENLYKDLQIRYSIRKYISKLNHKSSSINTVARINGKILGKYLYQDGCIGLQRKYEKYKLF